MSLVYILLGHLVFPIYGVFANLFPAMPIATQ